MFIVDTDTHQVRLKNQMIFVTEVIKSKKPKILKKKFFRFYE